MRTISSTDMWNTVLNILKLFPAKNIHPGDLSEDQNFALDQLASMITSRYCDRLYEFEYQVNQAISRKYVSTIDRSTTIQFSISPEDSRINVLKSASDLSSNWSDVLCVENGVLYSRAFAIRLSIRVDALNKKFRLDDASSRKIKKLFGSVYHSNDIVCPELFTVASAKGVLCNIDHLCEMQKGTILRHMINTAWLDEYLKRYRDAVAISDSTTL